MCGRGEGNVITQSLMFCRSNPDILRSTLEADDIKGGEIGWAETLRRHADPGSQVPTPFGSSEQLNNLNDIS